MIKVNIENNVLNEFELGGNMFEIISHIGYIIAYTYSKLKTDNEDAAETFRSLVLLCVNEEESPVWSGMKAE